MTNDHVLPVGYAVRRPRAADLGGVLDTLVASDIADFGEPDWSEGDLRDAWRDIDLATDAWLVTAPNGAVAGYTSLTHRNHARLDAEGYVHPAHQGRGVGTTLVRLTEPRAREHLPLAPVDARVTLFNSINGRNAAARALLEREGYAQARHFWRMRIDLDPALPPPPPAWPAGIMVRSVATAADERAAYAAIDEAFQDHWGHQPTTFEAWLARHKGEGHETGLWFLARDGDEVAGAAICRYQLGMGWVDSLGVRRAWRRRGLGMALLRHAFAEFLRRERPTVALGVDAGSKTGATRLYEAAGMRVEQQYAIYEKELRPRTERTAGAECSE